MTTDKPCQCTQQPPGKQSGDRTLWVSAAVSLAVKVVADVIGKWLS